MGLQVWPSLPRTVPLTLMLAEVRGLRWREHLAVGDPGVPLADLLLREGLEGVGVDVDLAHEHLAFGIVGCDARPLRISELREFAKIPCVLRLQACAPRIGHTRTSREAHHLRPDRRGSGDVHGVEFRPRSIRLRDRGP